MTRHDQLMRYWNDPPAEYRGAPFWGWSGVLDPARLQRQIESMHGAGMGGFFMHSRNGLKTPYLSEQWFDCVRACVEKARDLGMKAYLYDEDRWPSGDAGGFVTREHPELRAVTLRAFPSAQPGAEGKLQASFIVETDDGGRMESYCRLETGNPEANLCFASCVNSTSGRHNDSAYIDVFNPDATDEFIRLTHEEYARRFGEDFGELIPAIFFDEPQYQASCFYQDGSARLPWSPGFAAEFVKRYGYDLLDDLPELVRYQTRGEFSRVRHDYYRMCTELMVKHYTEPLGKWCAEHKIALTGHLLGEADIFQTIVVGSCMQHYEHMQWPGIDVLRDQAPELSSAKQASSVADQLGKERVLSELYGLTGWDWPLEGHKFIGDWHFAAGVNFRCHHVSTYTMAGAGKRDFPASISHHSPWWSCYKVVEDYFGRLGVALTQGVPVRDVLVLHVVESAWGIFGPGGWNSEVICRLQKGWERVFQTLTGRHIDWDFGDESLMQRHAKVEGDALHVGRMSYKVVVVPPSYTIRRSTLELLRQFNDGGGKVLFVGRLADHVDAVACDDLREFAVHCSSCGEQHHEIAEAVDGLLERRLRITEQGEEQTCIWAMLRQIEAEAHLLFVQSHDRNGGHTVQIRVRGRGPVVRWDALSGRRHGHPACAEGGCVEFELTLPPSGSALLSMGLDVPEAEPFVAPASVVHSRTIEGPFSIELTESNTLPLDSCQFRIGDEPFSCEMPSPSAESQIRRRLGAPPVGAQQPWYLDMKVSYDPKPMGRCQIRRRFHVSDIPSRCFLALEQVENFSITLNGKGIAGTACGSWVDEDIHTVDITAGVIKGENVLLFDLDYRADMQLEDMYLVGDFGVRKILAANERKADNYTLTGPVRALNLGSWAGQGLDFYGGSVKYRIHVEAPEEGRLQVELPNVACTAAVLWVGGRRFVLPWAPFSADITDALKEGENEVIVEIIGGRKNILGPLHTPWTSGTHPGKFYPTDKDWTDNYLLTDHGLMSPVGVLTLR